MGIGYQTVISLAGQQLLANSANISNVRNRIDSEGSYVAQNFNQAVNKVHIYDWETLTVNFDFELTNQIWGVLRSWILNRNEPRSIVWNQNSSMEYEFEEAFWTSISASVSNNQLVRANVSCEVLQSRDGSNLPINLLEVGADYAGQKMNIGEALQDVIPYWKTNVSTSVSNSIVSGWEVHFTNTFNKHFTCSGSGSSDFHPGPAYVSFGLASVESTVNFALVNGGGEVPEEIGVNIEIDGSSISLGSLEYQDYDIALSGFSQPQEYSYSGMSFFKMLQ